MAGGGGENFGKCDPDFGGRRRRELRQVRRQASPVQGSGGETTTTGSPEPLWKLGILIDHAHYTHGRYNVPPSPATHSIWTAGTRPARGLAWCAWRRGEAKPPSCRADHTFQALEDLEMGELCSIELSDNLGSEASRKNNAPIWDNCTGIQESQS